jgi:hypothetical protein
MFEWDLKVVLSFCFWSFRPLGSVNTVVFLTAVYQSVSSEVSKASLPENRGVLGSSALTGNNVHSSHALFQQVGFNLLPFSVQLKIIAVPALYPKLSAG